METSKRGGRDEHDISCRLSPEASHLHGWAFLFRWDLPVRAFAQTGPTLPPQAQRSPPPQGSSLFFQVTETWFLFPHQKLGFRSWKEKESDTNQPGVIVPSR